MFAYLRLQTVMIIFDIVNPMCCPPTGYRVDEEPYTCTRDQQVCTLDMPGRSQGCMAGEVRI